MFRVLGFMVVRGGGIGRVKGQQGGGFSSA